MLVSPYSPFDSKWVEAEVIEFVVLTRIRRGISSRAAKFGFRTPDTILLRVIDDSATKAGTTGFAAITLDQSSWMNEGSVSAIVSILFDFVRFREVQYDVVVEPLFWFCAWSRKSEDVFYHHNKPREYSHEIPHYGHTEMLIVSVMPSFPR